MTTFEATVPLGHQGWGTEENVLKIDRQALVVYAVYKSKMTRSPMQGDIATRDRIHKSDVDSHLQMVDDL